MYIYSIATHTRKISDGWRPLTRNGVLMGRKWMPEKYVNFRERNRSD